MTKTRAITILKTAIRVNSPTLIQWKEDEISYGVMAELLAESIMRTAEEMIGMIPPVDPNTKSDSGAFPGSGICQWEQENDQE